MQRPPLTDPKQIGEFLTSMKKQMAQIEGEITMMKNDGQSSLFNSVANLLNDVWGQKEKAEQEARNLKTTLEEIYNGHPDIKIAMEKKAKEEPKSKPKKS